jgi:hypothetical protein
MGKLLLPLIAGLAVLYSVNTAPRDYGKSDRYPLPKEIEVIDTTCPYETRTEIRNKDGLEVKVEHKIVKTEDIDFSKPFQIRTERYRIVSDEDWLPSRLIGHLNSLPMKLFFWDWNYAWGQNKERIRASLSMIENDKEIKNLTLRLNHNEAFYDMYRMFTEKHLRERNNFFARVLLGVPSALLNEIFAEFTRGSYYNPLTGTAACYSNIESVTAHELGHHKDFQRFDSDWFYALTGAIPPFPIRLYQEWQASKNAEKIMIKEDKWQFNRYLIPAFATYVLASLGATHRILFGKKKE